MFVHSLIPFILESLTLSGAVLGTSDRRGIIFDRLLGALGTLTTELSGRLCGEDGSKSR